MRKLLSTFETNGSRAIIVPRTFSADIAGKYGSMKRGARNPRTSLVYRTTADGKRKPLREKPATIVRVQVNMPQPAPIVKVQETRVIRERVVVKEHVPTPANVHKERTERDKPVIRERIVEREKPVIQERIVERDKPPIVQERIVERDKPPVIRERIVEREKPPIVQERMVEREKPITRETIAERQKTQVEQGRVLERESILRRSHTPVERERVVDRGNAPVVQARQADERTRVRDSDRNAKPLNRNTNKTRDRREQISKIFNEQVSARELAFRMMAEATNRIDVHSAAELTDVSPPEAPGEQAGTSPTLEPGAAVQARIIINARRGSIEPSIYKQRPTSLQQQRVRVSPRRSESRSWSAVVMINRKHAERLKSPDNLARQSNATWKLATQQQAIERYVTPRLVEQTRGEASGSHTVRVRETTSSPAERAREVQESSRGEVASQSARQSAEEPSIAGTERAAQSNPISTINQTEADRITKPGAQSSDRKVGKKDTRTINKLEIESQLVADESSIDRITFTTLGELPVESTMPIRLRVVGASGITVRLLSANAERLGSTMFLRGRADSKSASVSTPSDHHSASRLILRRIAATPDTFVTARRAPVQQVEPTATARGKPEFSSGRPNGQAADMSVTSEPTTTSKRSRNASLSDRSPTSADSTAEAARMTIAARTNVRRVAPNGQPKQPPISTSVGTIVHASQRWLAAVRRAERANPGHAANAASNGQPVASPATPRAPTLANQTLRRQREVNKVNNSTYTNANTGTNANANNSTINNANNSTNSNANNSTNSNAYASARAGTSSNPQPSASVSNPGASGSKNGPSPSLGASADTNVSPTVNQAATTNTANAGLTGAASVSDPSSVSGNGDRLLPAESSEPASTAKLTRGKSSREPELVHREPDETTHPDDAESVVRHRTNHPTGSSPQAKGNVNAVDAGTTEEPVRAQLIERSTAAPSLRFTFRNRPSEAAEQAAIANAAAQATSASAGAQAATAQAASASTPASASAAAPQQGRVAARPARESRQGETAGRQSQMSPSTTATLVVRRGAGARQRNAQLIQRATAMRTSASAAARIADPASAWRTSPNAASLTRERVPMTMLSHLEPLAQPDDEAEQPLAAMQSRPPMTTLRRQSQPGASRSGARPTAAIPAPAAMELRRSVAPPTNAPPEPAPSAVVVEAPPQIDAKQLQKAIESLPQLNPDELADKVYSALMKKMKFEQRLRGY